MFLPLAPLGWVGRADGVNIVTGEDGVQSMRLVVGPGLGVNWTVTFSIKNQMVNTSQPEQRSALQFSFQPPILTSLSRTNGSTSGG